MLDRINSRWDIAEGKVNLKALQWKLSKRKCIEGKKVHQQKSELSFNEFWDNIRLSNISVTGVLKKREEDRKNLKISDEKLFPVWLKL